MCVLALASVLCNQLLLNWAFISLFRRQGPSHPPLRVEVIHIRNSEQDLD